MKIKSEKSYGIVGTTICDINNREMRQMVELRDRIAHVLQTHSDEKLKNEYLTDDELEMAMTILMVFTREFEINDTSAFDDALKELKNAKKPSDPEPTPQMPIDEE